MVKTANLTTVEFNKHISKPELSNDDFNKIFEELNDVYLELSKEIINKNNDRNEILDKIRIAQKIYKKKLGINNDNVNLVDNQNNDSNQNDNGNNNDDSDSDTDNSDDEVPKVKTTKKDSTKTTQISKTTIKETKTTKAKSSKKNNIDEELESDNELIDNLEKKLEDEVQKKTPVSKTKATKTKFEPEIEENNDAIDVKVKTKTTKTSKTSKKKSEPKQESDTEPEIETKPEIESKPEPVSETKSKASKTKTTKSNKK